MLKTEVCREKILLIILSSVVISFSQENWKSGFKLGTSCFLIFRGVYTSDYDNGMITMTTIFIISTIQYTVNMS